VLVSAAVGAGLLAITEIFQAFAFGRAVDYPLMGYGVIIVAIASLVGGGFLTEFGSPTERNAIVSVNADEPSAKPSPLQTS
jgi:hypothetical protein